MSAINAKYQDTCYLAFTNNQLGSDVVNILREFQKELGYVNATNQYIEMISRYFQMEHEDDTLLTMAKYVNLSLTQLPEKCNVRIAKGYIVGVQSCLERFLTSFKELEGNPTKNVEPFNAKRDNNRLFWVLNASYNKNIPSEVLNLYYICNYYRLVRNEIVHMGAQSSEFRNAKSIVESLTTSLLSNAMFDKLNAPNDISELTFDDQVLFSRAAKRICERIYKDSEYDWKIIIEGDKAEIHRMICKVSDCIEKRNKQIFQYLSQLYPVKKEPLFDVLENMKL